MRCLAALLLDVLLIVACIDAPDWSGHFESRGYTVIVTATQTGYECQWLDGQGVLAWYGVIGRDEVGRYVESYPPELSPRGCPAYEWQTDDKGNPLRVVRDGSVWDLKRLVQ